MSLILSSVICFSAIIGLYLFMRSKFKYPDRNVVWGLPILGSVLDLTVTKIFDTILNYSKIYGPIFDIFIAFQRITIVCDFEDCKEILLKRPRQFRRDSTMLGPFTTIGLKNGVLVAEGQEWGKYRKVTSPPFSKLKVNAMLSAIWFEAETLIDELDKFADGKTSVNFIHYAESFTVRVIGKVAFGFTEKEGAYFYSPQFIKDMESMLTFFMERVLFPFPDFLWQLTSKYPLEAAAKEATTRVKEFANRVLFGARMQSPVATTRLNFIHSIRKAEEELKLDDEEIISNILTFFVGGTETTSLGISWTLFHLCQHPDIMNDLVKEVEGLDPSLPIAAKIDNLPLFAACFQEAMRINGPVFHLGIQPVETVTEPIVLSSGRIIRPNDTLWIVLDNLKMNPDVFENPHEFNPYRWLTSEKEKLVVMNEYCMTFGSGPRVCPGMELAKAEGIMALALLVKNYKISLNCQADEVHRILALTVHINKLPLILSKRM